MSKNFFKLRRQKQQADDQNETANLIIDKMFELSKAAELIYKIVLAVKKKSDSGQILLSKTLQKVINHSIYRSKWKKTVKNKLADLISFNIWKLVKRISEMSIVSCKWVFLMKYKTDDHSERFKVRLVVRNFTQQFDVDYENIFISVIWFDSLRILLTLTARFWWVVHMMNVQNIYLNSKLNKIIYMNVSERVKHLSDEVCKLLKSLYRLRQSANLWNKKIIKMLKSLEFKSILTDVSIFTHS